MRLWELWYLLCYQHPYCVYVYKVYIDYIDSCEKDGL